MQSSLPRFWSFPSLLAPPHSCQYHHSGALACVRSISRGTSAFVHDLYTALGGNEGGLLTKRDIDFKHLIVTVSLEIVYCLFSRFCQILWRRKTMSTVHPPWTKSWRLQSAEQEVESVWILHAVVSCRCYNSVQFLAHTGVAIIYQGLENSWKVLYKSLQHATVQTVDHKWVLMCSSIASKQFDYYLNIYIG